MKKIMVSFFVLFIFIVSLTAKSNKTYYNKNLDKSKIEIEFFLKGQDVFDDYEKLNVPSEIAIFNYYQAIEYENGTLLVFWKFNNEYVSDTFFKDIKYISESRPGIRLYWKNNGENYQEAVDKKYFKVNGKTVSAEVKYLKAEEIEIENNDGVFKKKIALTQFVTFQGKTFGIITDCYVVPFATTKNTDWKKATSADDIIKIFGLPDKREKYFFEWPTTKVKNGIYYKPDVKYSLSGEQWRYMACPDLVIDISAGNKVRDFSTSRDFAFFRGSKNNK